MALADDTPDWARELALAFESGAHGQFVLHGNVADRFPLQGRRVGLLRCLDALLLGGFEMVFAYDPGNGLSILRGAERLAEWPVMKDMPALPRDPRQAMELVSRFVRFRHNLAALGRTEFGHVAIMIRSADQILPAGRQGDFDIASLASLVRDWASEPPFCDVPFASFLITDQLADLHPLIASHPRVDRVRIPLPNAATLRVALAQLRVDHPKAFQPDQADDQAAEALTGVSLSALQSLVRRRAHEGQQLQPSDWAGVKKTLIEGEAEGLLEFIEAHRTLDDYHAQEALKVWLRQDIALWRAGDLQAMPMGYIFCGPVGTGKTYLVECLAGEAGVPVVKLKNFRDKWVGSSEGNLEKIFRLIRALGRCIVFIDEADQTLGKRDGGSSDSGLSGRLYSMIAQEMSNSRNRGRVMWILASSRPDLIEVDLKRPGRIDVKVPLLPTTTVEESARLLRALLKRFSVEVDLEAMQKLDLPTLLTPGAAEALAVKVYRRVRTEKLAPLDALAACLDGYQAPVPLDVLEFQMRIAIREATDMAFVPPSLRPLGDVPVA
jgi:hypothetical protein